VWFQDPCRGEPPEKRRPGGKELVCKLIVHAEAPAAQDSTFRLNLPSTGLAPLTRRPESGVLRPIGLAFALALLEGAKGGTTMNWILVGIDDSPESEKALRFAAELARSTGRGLRIVHSRVVPNLDLVAYPELEESANQHAQHILDAAANRCEREGLKVEKRMLADKPAESIAKVAEESDVDMVVVGHRGRNAVARLLLGSVADRLVQICPKSTVVVR
jgi:nucleotide-binding universal stress UspA family protein